MDVVTQPIDGIALSRGIAAPRMPARAGVFVLRVRNTSHVTWMACAEASTLVWITVGVLAILAAVSSFFLAIEPPELSELRRLANAAEAQLSGVIHVRVGDEDKLSAPYPSLRNLQPRHNSVGDRYVESFRLDGNRLKLK